MTGRSKGDLSSGYKLPWQLWTGWVYSMPIERLGLEIWRYKRSFQRTSPEVDFHELREGFIP
jgi:hypothetical protein